MLLSRYKPGQRSHLSLYQRASSTSALSKLAYHTTKKATLTPMSSASAPVSGRKDDSEPIADIDVPTTMTTVQQYHGKHHKDIVFPNTAPLPPELKSDADYKLLIEKLDACCILPDFADLDADQDAKSKKKRVLQELGPIFASAAQVKDMPKHVIDKFFDMLQVNLFRGIPLAEKKYLFFDEEPILTDIAWPHLSLVYGLLIDFFKVAPKDPHFDSEFELKMTKQCAALDYNERSQVLTFFKAYVIAYPDRELRIWRRMAYMLMMYKEGVTEPFAVTPILVFFSVRFADLTKPELIEESNKIFDEAIIPLISSRHLASHWKPLQEIFGIFIGRDASVAVRLTNEVIRRFPEAKPSKQILFLNMLSFLAEKLSLDDFQILARRLFNLYARVARYSASKIVEASFRIWGNVNIIPKVLENTSVIFPLMHPAISTAMWFHWNNSTQNAALNALKSMNELDPLVFTQLNQTTNKKNVGEADEAQTRQVHKNWALVARQAAKVDRTFNLAQALTEMQMKFNNPHQKQAAPTRNSTEMRRSNFSSPNLG